MDSAQAAELILFLVCLLGYALYNVFYFFRGHFHPRLWRHSIDLWTTARKTRTLWAEDLM